MTITIYGATDCDDTERTRNYLTARAVPFTEVNIDHHPDAERFVIFINGGSRSTPTVVVGAGKHKHLWTEPTDAEIEQLLQQASATYSVSP